MALGLFGFEPPRLQYEDVIYICDKNSKTKVKYKPRYKEINASLTGKFHREYDLSEDGEVLYDTVFSLNIVQFSDDDYEKLKAINGKLITFFPHNDNIIYKCEGYARVKFGYYNNLHIFDLATITVEARSFTDEFWYQADIPAIIDGDGNNIYGATGSVNYHLIGYNAPYPKSEWLVGVFGTGEIKEALPKAKWLIGSFGTGII